MKRLNGKTKVPCLNEEYDIVYSLLNTTKVGVEKIGVFKYKKGVNDKPGTPNYDLKKLAIETTSKRIYPNFVNVSAPHLPQDGDYNNEAESMGYFKTMSPIY